MVAVPGYLICKKSRTDSR